MSKKANPQGKGLVPLLHTLREHWLEEVVLPKQIDQIEMELFTSLFVLQSELKFNPVPLKQYYMYETDSGHRLLMVGPDEWHTPYPGRYIGECMLQSDRTWTLKLDPALEFDGDFMNRIGVLRARLHQAMEKAERLEDILPVFEAKLDYHGRVMAFILGRSLLMSMQLGGIRGLDYRAAKGLLHKP